MLAQALKSLRAGDVETALADARRYLETQPDDPEGHHLLGVILRATGDLDGAAASIDRAIELAPDVGAFHLARASLMIDRRDIIPAKVELARAIEADPNQLASYLLLANYALASGDGDEAGRLLRLAQRVDAEHPQVLLLAGQLQAARGETDGAIATFTRALQRAPNDVLVQTTLGLAYLRQGHHAFAGELLAKAVAAHPGQRSIRWALVQSLRAQERFAEILPHLDVLLAERPDDPAALTLRGDLGIRFGRLDIALADYRRVLELADQPAELLSGMLGVLLNYEHRQAARELAESELARSPLDDRLWQARLRVDAGDPLAQIETIQRWAAALPDSPAGLEARAQLAELQGDDARARELAERAVASESNRPGAEFVLIRADLRDDPAAALVRLERAFNAAQGNAGRRMVLWLEGIALDRLDRIDEAADRWRQMFRHSVPGLPLPASGTPEARIEPDGGPMPKLLWTLPGSRPERLLSLLSTLPCGLTADRFGDLPRADGLGPVKALDPFGQPAETVPTWRRLLADRGLDPVRLIEWIPNWDERLAARLPGSRVLAMLRDPRDLLLDLVLDGGPQHYQIPSFEIAADWLCQALDPLLRRVEAGDPDVLLLRGEAIDRDPGAALDRIAAFFAFERPAGSDWNEPSTRSLGGIPRSFPPGHWQRYRTALGEPLAALDALAERIDRLAPAHPTAA